jgi:hypothetical protein
VLQMKPVNAAVWVAKFVVTLVLLLVVLPSCLWFGGVWVVAKSVGEYEARHLERHEHESGTYDLAILRNGNSIRHQRRQVAGAVTRLYLTDSGGYIEIPTDQIERFEKDTAPNTKLTAPTCETIAGNALDRMACEENIKRAKADNSSEEK